MGMFPCDAGSHRYVGAQQTIYPALVDGGDARRRKLRLCPNHFLALLEKLDKSAQRATGATDGPIQDTCLLCGEHVGNESPLFFATVYASRAEREDYWAPVHGVCAAAVAEDWSLPA